MRVPRCHKLLLLALSLFAVLVPTALAAAACPVRPLPPCKPTAFTGKAQSSQCSQVPPSCRDREGPRGRPGPRGVPGKTGATGKTGARGPTGAGGAQGATGSQGAPGATGATGPQGLPGVQGNAGSPGATGPQGPQGTAGPQGPAGPQGSTGATGATGPAGPAGPANGLSAYGYVFNEGAQVVPTEAEVTFDSNGVLNGIIHATGTSQIQVVNAGDYKVTFSTSGVEPSQFSLFRNGVPVPGTVYGSGAGTQQNLGQVIVTLGAGDVLTVRNHTSSAAVTLQTLAGGTQTSVNASVAIEKLD